MEQLSLTNDEREVLKDICSKYSQPTKHKYLKERLKTIKFFSIIIESKRIKSYQYEQYCV